jgi:hypothetical protein
MTSKRKWRRAGVLAGVFAASLVVRALYLGRTALWGDEILFVNLMATVRNSPWTAFTNYWEICVAMGQLPLAGVLMNLYMHAASAFVSNVLYDVAALRLPGVVAGAGAVVGIHVLGRRWVRREVNWAATAMAAVFFFPVYYSREVYCYPWVMLFAAFAYLYFHKGLFDARADWRTHAALFAWASGLGLTHFGCSVALAAMGVAASLRWLRTVKDAGHPRRARNAARTMLACGLAGATVAPYWVHILRGGNPHVASTAPYSLGYILNDGATKFFLGDRFVPAVLAWIALGLGLAALWRRARHPVGSRMAAGLFVATGMGLAILSKNSTYVSSLFAWNGPDFQPMLHGLLRDLMSRFPVSYYLRSPTDEWTEPEAYYLERAEYRNPQTMALRRYGIFPSADTDNLHAESRDILYNTPKSALRLAVRKGQPVYVEFFGMRCTQVLPNVYGRIVSGGQAQMVFHNLTGEPIWGRIKIEAIVESPNAGTEVDVVLATGYAIGASVECNTQLTVDIPPILIPPGPMRVLWAASDPAVKNTLVLNVQFVPEEQGPQLP